MRRWMSWRSLVVPAAAVIAVTTLAGAGSPKKKSEPPPPKVDETLATIAYVRQSETRVEGVGLVVGLNGTGGTTPPSTMRTDLVDEMRKAGVDHAERWLDRKDTSMVIVKGTIPSGMNTKDGFDVDVELPPGCATTSLQGGKLLITQLRQVVITPDAGTKKSMTIATVGGPIMIGKSGDPNNAKVGRVLGGAHVKTEVPYTMIIRDERKSGHTVRLVEAVIKRRFHQSDGIEQKGMAIGKTDQILVLKVPKIYHHNQARYFQVLQALHVVESPQLVQQRLERWEKELLDPKTAGRAAIKLEALGSGSLPTLKKGIASTDPDVQFFAAEALAYLGDPSGAEILADSAVKRSDFRAPALKALSAMDQSAGIMKLRSLLGQADFEVRYGAFDALRTADPGDPFLGRINVYDDPEEQATEDLALQIGNLPKRRKAVRPEDPFELYLVDCDGPPMVHVARNLRCEIVVFGRNQKLLTPAVLGAGGPILLNAAEGDQLIQISRIDATSLDGRENRVTCPTDLGVVVRQVAQLGATYPDIVEMLTAAFKQKNLQGPLVVDAVPLRSKAYDEAQLAGRTKKDDAVNKASAESSEKKRGLFSRFRERMKR